MGEAESSLLEPQVPGREQTGSLPSLNDILPPSKLLTKVPEPPQTASPTENQVFKSLSQGVCGGDNSHSNRDIIILSFLNVRLILFYACF